MNINNVYFCSRKLSQIKRIMKNLIIVVALSAISLWLLSSAKIENKLVISDSNNDISFEIPSNVQVIIDKSCYACHNPESSSVKGKMKLNFVKLPDMKVSKQISKLMKISKVIRNGKMPKEKYIKKHPEKRLTNDEAVALSSWASDLAGKLAGE